METTGNIAKGFPIQQELIVVVVDRETALRVLQSFAVAMIYLRGDALLGAFEPLKRFGTSIEFRSRGARKE